MRGCIRFICVVSLLMASGALASDGPRTISPGRLGEMVEVRGSCPTFHWHGDSGAIGFEVVVWSARDRDPEGDAGAEAIAGRVPSGTTSWTPDSAECLTPGESYTWRVRALTGSDVRVAGEWSEARFFTVSTTPSLEEIDRALDVLRRYRLELTGSPAGETEENRSNAAQPKGNRQVPSASAAIRGEQPDSSGETYGVVGLSSSAGGAGVGAANTAGGPDLTLDGGAGAPALFDESGVDRPSAGDQTFSFNNSGGGAMTVDVGGVPLATTADVSAHAGSADHDGRYFTETELAASGGGGAVHWDNVSVIPAGFADGVDDDTTYTAGAGLALNGNEFSTATTHVVPRPNTITVVDDSEDCGQGASMAIGADGLPLISYHCDDAALKVAHCEDPSCTTATITTIDAQGSGSVDPHTSIAIGADGLGLIAWTRSGLNTAHCENLACTSVTTTLDHISAFDFVSLAIGSDGLGLISYYNGSALEVAHCYDAACTGAETNTVSAVPTAGHHNSLAIGADGLGLIVFRVESGDSRWVAHCDDLACSTSTITDHVPTATFSGQTSLTTGAGGVGVLSYRYEPGGGGTAIGVTHCANAVCTSISGGAVFETGPDVGRYSSVTVSPQGLDLVAYYDGWNGDLKLGWCVDSACSSYSMTTLDSAGDVGLYPSITIGADSLPIIAYYEDGSPGRLKLMHCGSSLCAPYLNPR